VGASGQHQDGWLPTEIEFLDVAERFDWQKIFKPASLSAIVAEHVWEHLTLEKAEKAAKNCYEFLAPGGYARIAVPDGYHPEKDYIDWVKPGGVGDGAKDHQMLYTYKTLSILFEEAGFKVHLLEYFDEQHEFHYTRWNHGDGHIHRSRHDPRNVDRLVYTSIIIDAVKPESSV